jgi:hypothetical protein
VLGGEPPDDAADSVAGARAVSRTDLFALGAVTGVSVVSVGSLAIKGGSIAIELFGDSGATSSPRAAGFCEGTSSFFLSGGTGCCVGASEAESSRGADACGKGTRGRSVLALCSASTGIAADPSAGTCKPACAGNLPFGGGVKGGAGAVRSFVVEDVVVGGGMRASEGPAESGLALLF